MMFSPRLIGWAQRRAWYSLYLGLILAYGSLTWVINSAGEVESSVLGLIWGLTPILGVGAIYRLRYEADICKKVDHVFQVNFLEDPVGARQTIERQLYHDARQVRQYHDLCAGGKLLPDYYTMYELFYEKDAHLAHKALGLPERRWDEIHPPFSATACC